MEKIITVENTDDAVRIMGSLNCHARKIDDSFGVKTELLPEGMRISGEEQAVEQAAMIYERMREAGERGAEISDQLVQYLISGAQETNGTALGFSPEFICVNAKGRPIHSKTAGQRKYVNAIRDHELTFAIGPAGTGKTYLAVAMAVKAFRAHEVSRIILTRPAVEAGEKLGFLPGDLQMKVDPYMRPLYDALHDLMGTENYFKNLEKGLIEVSPLAYMRGRTLDDAFIILDEAQNTTAEQMKMFLTRIGFHSKAIVTGDITQVDLPRSQRSGLVDMPRILRKVEGVQFVELTRDDVVRNPLVQRIIDAYEKEEERKKNRRKPAKGGDRR